MEESRYKVVEWLCKKIKSCILYIIFEIPIRYPDGNI